MKRWSGYAALALALVWALRAGHAGAHANLVRAEPAANSAHAEPPAQLTLWFSEALSPSASSIEVLRGDGWTFGAGQAQLDRTDPAVMRLPLPPLEPGLYTVSWRALSAVDGHLTRGVYAFTVGDEVVAPGAAIPSGPRPGSFGEAQPFDVLARVLSLIGAALITGAFGAHLALWRPVRATLRLPAAAGDRAFERLVGIGVAIAMVAVVPMVLAQIVAAGSLGTFASFLAQSRFGRDLVVRLVLLVLLDLLAGRVDGSRGRVVLLGGLALSGGLLATTTVLSHSAGVEESRLAALLNDWLHLAAASLWIGGLAYLLFVALPALRPAAPEDRSRGTAALVARFSALGAASVAALLLSGLYSTWLHAGSLEALRATAYGQTLLAKLAVFVPLLALAALNLLHWRRRVAGSAPAQQGFLRTLRAEAAVGVLVLALAGLLTGLGPARSALEARQAEALTMRAAAGPLRASLTIRPPQAGPAQYEVSLTSPDGAPYEIARTVRLRFTPPDPSLGLAEARAEHQGGGRYSVEGAYLTLAGAWQVELQVQRPDGYDVFTRFDLEVDGAVRPASTGRGAQALGAALGWGLVAGGLVVTLFAFWLRRQRQHFAMAPLVLIMGLALLTTGALQRYDAFARWNTPVPVGNPVLPTEASIARGEALYQARCQSCHGTEGRGDGPLAASLDPPPADLRAHVPLHADAELFGVIADGIPGTAMPPHRDVLEEEAIWDVVNYLRALTGR